VSRNAVHGVLCVDKPVGPTSHDVVSQVRRRLGTRRVGHAGTLDPLASGLLVILVGEATKLGPFLTGQDKRYEAELRFGRSTTTLDAEGDTTREQATPEWLRDELRAIVRPDGRDSTPRLDHALDHERARVEQVPPMFSAIKIGGRRSHALARQGEIVELPPRPARVVSLDVVTALPEEEQPTLTVELHVAKGYYVRSFARDLGECLELPSHLSALRRTQSGRLTVSEALAPSEVTSEGLMSLEQAIATVLPMAELTERGAYRASVGQALDQDDFDSPPESDGAVGWVHSTGHLVAIGKRGDNGTFAVERGFCHGVRQGCEEDRDG